jgi:hypothetical protein
MDNTLYFSHFSYFRYDLNIIPNITPDGESKATIKRNKIRTLIEEIDCKVPHG